MHKYGMYKLFCMISADEPSAYVSEEMLNASVDRGTGRSGNLRGTGTLVATASGPVTGRGSCAAKSYERDGRFLGSME